MSGPPCLIDEDGNALISDHARLNWELRQDPSKANLSPEVQALSPELQAKALQALAQYRDFDPEDDDDEQDFGRFIVDGVDFWWHITTMDDNGGYPEDPADAYALVRTLHLELFHDND